ncbi:dihydroneopterin aldolase [Limibaculum sp. M0105]|uniref:dihydroneopterin aldolase n=1 Tax=Thermohalobaculum xanthum TaxID=2753746 RepID=A0A8J7MA75_9RHOB|nr:dihydroneopterin aldolase [Thermohalobaculum xanthum]MBK0400620.1 dihydroneopterin aldolase [Thermohalobaculum xanthum]
MVERALLPHRLDIETEQAGPQDKIADRIFLLDYTREIEIGAYAEEVGVTQRVRFDVVLEVTRNTAHIDDRVGRVINYDDLVDAIETIARGPRITLLETFAERLAQAVLVDPRARRVHVRIEKLDRLANGARLGVEISRVRTPETNEKIWALAPEVK